MDYQALFDGLFLSVSAFSVALVCFVVFVFVIHLLISGDVTDNERRP